MTTQFPETFDPETQEGNSWELLPAGEYVAQVVEASVQPPNSGDGFYLRHVENRRRRIRGPASLADYHVRAFQRTGADDRPQDLEGSCVALDVNEQVNDAEVFLFKPARIKVGIEKDKQGLYPDKNRISRILPLEAKPAEPEQPAQATAAKASSPAAATRAPKSTVGPGAPAPWHAQR